MSLKTFHSLVNAHMRFVLNPDHARIVVGNRSATVDNTGKLAKLHSVTLNGTYTHSDMPVEEYCSLWHHLGATEQIVRCGNSNMCASQWNVNGVRIRPPNMTTSES